MGGYTRKELRPPRKPPNQIHLIGELTTMTNQNELKQVADTEFKEPESAEKRLRVYRKNSDAKIVQNGGDKYWYSATRSDGSSVRCVFKGALREQVPDEAAFEIFNVVGNAKLKEVVKDGETYQNYTYYITSCEFDEIAGEELPL